MFRFPSRWVTRTAHPLEPLFSTLFAQGSLEPRHQGCLWPQTVWDCSRRNKGEHAECAVHASGGRSTTRVDPVVDPLSVGLQAVGAHFHSARAVPRACSSRRELQMLTTSFFVACLDIDKCPSSALSRPRRISTILSTDIRRVASRLARARPSRHHVYLVRIGLERAADVRRTRRLRSGFPSRSNTLSRLCQLSFHMSLAPDEKCGAGLYQDRSLCTIHDTNDFFALHVSVVGHIAYKFSRIDI